MADLRDDLRAAMGGAPAGGDEDDAAGAAAAAGAPEAGEGAGAALPTDGAERAAEGGDEAAAAAAKARDAQGKFAKAPDAGQTPSDAASAAVANPQTETSRVPPSLPAALKAKFHELPPEWQAQLAKRDQEVNEAKAQWDTKAQRLNRFDEIFAPRRNQLSLRGVDEFQTVQILLAAQDALDKNPIQGLADLARSYGVDLRQVAAQTNGQGQAPQEQLHPVLAQMQSTVETLSKAFESQEQAKQSALISEAQAEVTAFMQDPANLYFDNVKVDVAHRLDAASKAGQPISLKDAYLAAAWASPEIRPLLLAQEAAATAKPNPTDLARQKAAAAQRASGSVAGGPSGATQAAQAPSTGNLREDLRASLQEQSGRV